VYKKGTRKDLFSWLVAIRSALQDFWCYMMGLERVLCDSGSTVVWGDTHGCWVGVEWSAAMPGYFGLMSLVASSRTAKITVDT
jgi:hypothetical protein